jgi:hypothetical protein
MNTYKILEQAAKLAHSNDDAKHFFHGGIGIRSDGAKVRAINGMQQIPDPKHHCEARLCRKMDKGGTIFVARVLANGDWAMSKPCASCEKVMRRSLLRKVYYTIAPNEFGCIKFY